MNYKDISPEIIELSKSYQYHQTPSFILRIQEFMQTLIQLVNNLLNSIHLESTRTTDSRSFSHFLLILILGTSCTVLALIALRIYKKLNANFSQKENNNSYITNSEKILNSNDYKIQAGKFLEEQNFSKALRYLYLGTLQFLHEKKIVIFSPTKTNYEYQYLLSTYPEILEAFKELYSRVEEVCFGKLNPQKEDVEFCLNKLTYIESFLNLNNKSNSNF